MRRNVLGSKRDRLPVTSGRAGCVALAFQDVAQGVVGLGEVRIAHYDTADKVHGRAGVPHQVGHHAEQMQGIGMIRVSFQDSPIHGLGLDQVARRLVTAGLVQGGEERGARPRAPCVSLRPARPLGATRCAWPSWAWFARHVG